MPDYEISVDFPNRPDGDPIEVPPFGVIENRKGKITVDMDRELAEELASGYGIAVATQGGKKLKGKATDEPIDIVVGEEGGET